MSIIGDELGDRRRRPGRGPSPIGAGVCGRRLNLRRTPGKGGQGTAFASLPSSLTADDLAGGAISSPDGGCARYRKPVPPAAPPRTTPAGPRPAPASLEPRARPSHPHGCTHEPVKPSRRASSIVRARYATPCTRPVAIAVIRRAVMAEVQSDRRPTGLPLPETSSSKTDMVRFPRGGGRVQIQVDVIGDWLPTEWGTAQQR